MCLLRSLPRNLALTLCVAALATSAALAAPDGSPPPFRDRTAHFVARRMRRVTVPTRLRPIPTAQGRVHASDP